MPAHKLLLVHGTESESKYVEIFKQLLPYTDEAGEEKQILFQIPALGKTVDSLPQRLPSSLNIAKRFYRQLQEKALPRDYSAPGSGVNPKGCEEPLPNYRARRAHWSKLNRTIGTGLRS